MIDHSENIPQNSDSSEHSETHQGELPTQVQAVTNPSFFEKYLSSIGVTIAVVAIVLVGSGAAYWYLQNPVENGASNRAQVSEDRQGLPDQDTLNDSRDQLELENEKHIVYINESRNIALYNFETKAMNQVTNDAETSEQGTRIVFYFAPTFVDSERIFYQRCQRSGTTESDPYACSGILHSLKNGTKLSLFETTSELNPNDYQINGELSTVAVSPDLSELAVLYQDSEGMILSRLSVTAESQNIMNIFKPHPGRGGSLDDDVSLEYSPDGSMLLVTNTALDETIDKSTISVYSLEETAGTAIWRSPANELYTHGRWVDDRSIVMKHIERSDQTAIGRLVLLNPLTKNEETLSVDALTWYGIEYAGNNQIVFAEVHQTENLGVSMFRFDLSTRQKTALTENAYPLEASTGAVYVKGLTECVDCYGALNGFSLQGPIGIYDLDAAELEMSSITDVYWFDGR